MLHTCRARPAVLPAFLTRWSATPPPTLTHPHLPTLAQLSVADFLAEGDHVTRMLKDWGDQLDKRLPPPHRQLAAAGGGGEGHGHGPAASHGGGGAGGAGLPQMAPADVRTCVNVLRCILLLLRLAGRFVGRFLPQVRACGRQRAARGNVQPLARDGWLQQCSVQMLPTLPPAPPCRRTHPTLSTHPAAPPLLSSWCC